jgi:hypothetical protein
MTGTEGLAPTQLGQLTRRQHATRAIFLGGAVAALLSMIPVVGSLNMCFGLWIIFGGGLSVWHLQKKVGVVPMGEAAAVGALSGLVVGTMMLLLTGCLGTGFGAFIFAEGSRSDRREVLPLLAVLLTTSCVSTIVVYPVLACLGGILTPLLLKPTPVAALGPDGRPLAGPPPPPSPEELAQSAASRRKWTQIVGCGCLLLLGFCAVVCGTGGYLFYLEEGVDLEDTAGTEEIASVPFVSGQRIELTIPAGTGSSSRNAIWLVGQDALPPGLDVEGRYACTESSYAEPFMETLYTYSRGSSGHPEWKYLTSDYAYSYSREPSRCRFELTTTVPVPGARIVVTRLTKPSDWLD